MVEAPLACGVVPCSGAVSPVCGNAGCQDIGVRRFAPSLVWHCFHGRVVFTVTPQPPMQITTSQQ